MALFGFELEEIARLVALVDAQGLEEFIYEEEAGSCGFVARAPPKRPASTSPLPARWFPMLRPRPPLPRRAAPRRPRRRPKRFPPPTN